VPREPRRRYATRIAPVPRSILAGALLHARAGPGGVSSSSRLATVASAQAGDSIDACLDIGHATDNALKNQVFGTGESPQPDIRYLHEGPGSVVQLAGYSGPAAPSITDIANYLQPRNNRGGTPSVSGFASASSSTTSVVSCPQPAG
jgi:hypothetical protein